MDTPNRSLKQKAIQELKEYLTISFYLWLVFAVLIFYKSVILAEHHISFVAHGLALLNALALGKVMLVAQQLHFADRFKDEPLICPTLFKSAPFAVILGCFKILEDTLIGWYHGSSFSESIVGIGGGTLKGILSLVLLLAVLLIPFFGITELGKVFGEDKLATLFFTSRHTIGGSS
jgi:hypothetical protein